MTPEVKQHGSDVRRVLIVKSNLESFRRPFYSRLEQRLAQENIQLRVAVPRKYYGRPAATCMVPVPGGELRFGGKILSWQRIGAYAKHAHLVIAQQCARELTNYWLLAFRKRYGYRLALWGHGTEFQRTWTTPFTEFIKQHMFGEVDYWFAYTPGVAKIVESNGYARDRICSVFNSVDTNTEIAFHQSVSEASQAALRSELGMSSGAKLVVYCGALYKAKRLGFLVQACNLVRRAGVDLHLAVLGDGAERAALERMSREASWIHLVGPAYGQRKALHLATAECMVIPGVVGLAVVDAFAHECPLVTTSTPGHGPEIEYLADGVNGITTADNVECFAGALVSVLTDERLRDRLRQGCREAAAVITIENMVEHFAHGVMKALQLPGLA